MNNCNLCEHYPCKCNQLVPQNPVNLFGSPFDCKKQIRTRRFSSLNSPLSQEELDDLQICIETINDLLRSLGSEVDANNTRQLQLHFLDIKGIKVKANILCGLDIQEDDEDVNEILVNNSINGNNEGEAETVKLIRKIGKLANAGRDFIQINPIGSALFILYNNLLSISRIDSVEEEREPKFINADQDTRRELAFNFGEFVSKNADIENLFFGIPLHKALKKYEGKEVKIRTDKERHFGTLIETRDGKIQIQNKKKKQEIDINTICYIQVLNLK
ncbi:hypothetical protein [Ureibacillus acetophenoni]|uniref:Uncharacterized protein n=1 Tax=Ureibacillus acetophenoni TaxID=614649 RepID=A0A285U6A4_9BACL|nr:hypothetical protein [Ureibacillus acetophenoni]SOC37474.1 hypothetical protein SAMN05877842_103232 [Ureibacillus acetophenoni]